MKRKVGSFLATLLAIITVFLCAEPSWAAARIAQFTIGYPAYGAEGQEFPMDVAPFIENGRAYVPVRYLAYALGVRESDVMWYPETGQVTICAPPGCKACSYIQLWVDSNTLLINYGLPSKTAKVDMDVTPVLVDGRVMLPARWVAEAFGATVAWNPWNQQVTVSLPLQNGGTNQPISQTGTSQVTELTQVPPALSESDIQDITTPSIIAAIQESKIPPLSVQPRVNPSQRFERRPEIVGSSYFKEVVSEALDLLRERDREDYYLVCHYLPKVEEAPGSFAVIVNGQAQTFFLHLPPDYPKEDAIYYTVGGLVHEAVHTWLAEKGYQCTGEAGEYFATAAHMRSLLKVGAPDRMLQDPDEAIKARWWEQRQPVAPGLEAPAELHVTNIVPDNESPNTYRVTLSWGPVSGASGYKVYTKALWFPGAGYIATETQANSYTTSFYVGYPGAGAIGHPEGRASWEIYVTAVNAAGESPPSNVITVDLPPVASGGGAPAAQPGIVLLPPLQYSGGLETIRNTYTWDYEGKQFSWTIEVPQVLVKYEQHQKMVRWPLWFFLAAANPSMTLASLFATGSPHTMAHELLANMLTHDKASSEYIGYVAERLNEAAEAQGYDAFHKAEFIAAFVQSIPYKIFLPTNTAYPPQVIAYGGDCINKSVLLAAILKKLGYRVAIFVYPFPVAHAAAGVGFSLEEIPPDRLDARSPLYGYTYEGVTYYFVETTEPGWRIGELSVETSIRPGVIPL